MKQIFKQKLNEMSYKVTDLYQYTTEAHGTMGHHHAQQVN